MVKNFKQIMTKQTLLNIYESKVRNYLKDLVYVDNENYIKHLLVNKY